MNMLPSSGWAPLITLIYVSYNGGIWNFHRCPVKDCSLPDLRHCPDICMEGLRNSMKDLGSSDRSLDRDLSRGPPENEALNRNTSSCASNGDHLISCGFGVTSRHVTSRHVTSPRCVRRDMTYYRDQWTWRDCVLMCCDWAGMHSSRRRWKFSPCNQSLSPVNWPTGYSTETANTCRGRWR
jgi:hypothetical protein